MAAHELAERGEFVTMGRFVGYLSDDALKASMTGVDDAGLLETAFVMEGKERLDRMLSLLPPTRLGGIRAAAERPQLWPETLDLLVHAGDERVAQIVADADADVLRGLAQAVERDGLWPPLLAIAERMRQDQLDRIARRLLGEGLDGHLGGLVAAVEATGRWEIGLRMLAGLPPDLKDQLAPAAATLDGTERKRALAQAKAFGLLDELGPIGDALKRAR
jgi:hypothetical protein